MFFGLKMWEENWFPHHTFRRRIRSGKSGKKYPSSLLFLIPLIIPLLLPPKKRDRERKKVEEEKSLVTWREREKGCRQRPLPLFLLLLLLLFLLLFPPPPPSTHAPSLPFFAWKHLITYSEKPIFSPILSLEEGKM